MIELNGPVIRTTAAVQGVTERLLQLSDLQRGDALRQGHAIEGVVQTVDDKPERRGRWQGAFSRSLNPLHAGQRLQALEIGQPPGLLPACWQTEPLKSRATTGLHGRKHTIHHGHRHRQATPWAASSRSTQS